MTGYFYQTLKLVSADITTTEKWRYIRFHENLYKVDRRMILKQAHDDGLAEGSESEKLKIARKMKDRGRSVKEIAEDTGLSVETIEKL